jgi:hypothetical protein
MGTPLTLSSAWKPGQGAALCSGFFLVAQFCGFTSFRDPKKSKPMHKQIQTKKGGEKKGRRSKWK